VDVVAGGYEDWVRQRKQDAATARAAAAPAARAAPAAAPSRPRTKLSYKDQRDYDLLPGRIEEIEAQIARDEALLADPELYTRDHARFAALTAGIEKARAERDAAEERWLALAEQVEELAS
jgi:ATP-binding cassette subfamily F protein uup